MSDLILNIRETDLFNQVEQLLQLEFYPARVLTSNAESLKDNQEKIDKYD